jgi:hypothetical protein
VLSVKNAHETYGLMKGGKFDFVLNFYLEKLVDYVLIKVGCH